MEPEANTDILSVVELRMTNGQIILKEILTRKDPSSDGTTQIVSTRYLNPGDDLSGEEERVKKIAEHFWGEVYK